jgi:hypothetical protein
LELRPKALSFVQQRRQNFGIYQQKQLKWTVFCSPQAKVLTKATQIDCTLFSRAAKISELREKSTVFSCRAATNFGIANQSTVFCSAPQRKNLELRTSTVFCSAADENFWNLPTKVTQINCILPAEKNTVLVRNSKIFAVQQNKMQSIL